MTKATKKQKAAAKWLKIQVAVNGLIAAHTVPHYMHGGNGVACFVWVNGSCVGSASSLDLSGTFMNEVLALDGVHYAHTNID
jgi:hypothetical protein